LLPESEFHKVISQIIPLTVTHVDETSVASHQNLTVLEGNDGVLGDGDVFGTDCAATGCDVAIADTVVLLQFTESIVVPAQHMAIILAQKALDTFPEFPLAKSTGFPSSCA
jgi:hypothetical protein